MKHSNSTHQIYFSGAQDMSVISDASIHLVVTSPPYPMIEMWDDIMIKQNAAIGKAFEEKDFYEAYELMHVELDKVWAECYRVMRPGAIACINIGDATRTLDKNFSLYPNHARIIQAFIKLGCQNLPNIIWRKQTNAPNKFMGSGMYPPGAYVTLEHEYILIFRKGRKREFKCQTEKENRRSSSYFWEERNEWFSDVWTVKGTKQEMADKSSRERSAAYPLEIPYRLINMYSVYGDTVLDPFLGTGTTTLAAMASARNSIGIDIDPQLEKTIETYLIGQENYLNDMINQRLMAHEQFVANRKLVKGEDAFKYVTDEGDSPVMTRQERDMKLPLLMEISKREKHYEVYYAK